MPRTCLDCRHHGPPVSAVSNRERCCACVVEATESSLRGYRGNGFPLWEAVVKPTAALVKVTEVRRETMQSAHRPDLVVVIEDGVFRGIFSDRPLLRGMDVAVVDFGVDMADNFVVTDDGDVCAVYVEEVKQITRGNMDEVAELRDTFQDMMAAMEEDEAGIAGGIEDADEFLNELAEEERALALEKAKREGAVSETAADKDKTTL